MARAPFTLTVLNASGDAVNGASVTVRKRADSSLATVYSAETGGGTASNPLTTDSVGRVTAWLERGAYRLDVSGAGVTAYSVNFDAAPAADGAVDATWLAAAALPIGVILPYGGSGDPAGGSWLVADGRAVSRSTYSALFAALGTTFGAGDGSTTFNLPDLRSRLPVGAGQGAGLSNRARGATGGAETHTLTPAETAIRNHIHNLPDNETAVETRTYAGGGASGIMGTATGVAATTNPNGGEANGAAHNNMPPFIALNYVVRVL